jgi:hypothetical protein
MTQNGLNLRGLTSLVAAAGFIVLVVSGMVAYVVPHGRIAYWTDWTFLGMTKTNWVDVHVLAGLLFVLAGLFHICFNWKLLAAYVVGNTQKGRGLKTEGIITVALLALFVVSGIYRIPPLSYFMDLSESLKGSWVSREYEPPFGRAELLGLNSFCKKMEIPLEQAVAALAANGIAAPDMNESLQDMAKRARVAPLKLYTMIKHLEAKPGPASAGFTLTPQMVEERYAGSGIGKKTISDISASMNLDASRIMQRLEALGILARVEEPLKQAAERNRLQPIELLKVILIESYSPER